MRFGAPLQRLTVDECLRLLGGTDLARLALTRHALPFVAPVRFHLRDYALLIAAEGCWPVAGAARDHQVVCLEADDIIAGEGGRWIVHVTGPLTPFNANGRAADDDPPLSMLSLSTAMVAGWRVDE